MPRTLLAVIRFAPYSQPELPVPVETMMPEERLLP